MLRLLILLLLITLLPGCVDPTELVLNQTVDVLVVDGTITDLDEPQLVRLSRSKAENGRFGTTPLKGAIVTLLVDSVETIRLREVDPGKYQAPEGFRGQPGRRYQLRFTLPDGSEYRSQTEIMPPATPIERMTVRFNAESFRPDQYNGFRSAHEVFMDVRDPAGQRNYYRWDWTLYEKQDWCRSCAQGVYTVNRIIPRTYIHGAYFVSGPELHEDCFTPVYDPSPEAPQVTKTFFVYDYPCRTQCWEIIRNYDLNLFDDSFTDGGLIQARKVAQLPFFTRSAALAVLRQISLTASAYQFFKQVEAQTENTGGVADTPPTAPIGNVRCVQRPHEMVVGYFAAAGVSQIRYRLDRKDTQGVPWGAINERGEYLPEPEMLFYALNKRSPNPEPTPPYTGERPSPAILIWGGPPRPPTAICVPSDSRTPVVPPGWEP